MRTEIRRLVAVLIVGAAAGAASVAGPGVAAQGGSRPANDRARFVGAFELVQTEDRDPKTGQWVRTPNFNSNGYIIFGDTGHMGVQIQPKVRPRFANNPPTGEEAQAALRGYAAYFGSFTVNDKEPDKFVVYTRFGQIDPGGPKELRRYYEFATLPNGAERLILTLAPPEGGKDKAVQRYVWQRMPDAPLSAEGKKFVGFWRLLYTDSYRTKDGKEVFHGDRVETRAGTSYIIYAASGHMMVHLMNREGRTPYAGPQPTPAESLAAYRSYTGYFGRFITYENHNPPFVYHSQQGTTNPGGYSEQKRFYQFNGNVLRLGGPPNLNANGEMAGGHLYWEKQGPIR
jgi:hypothetical protein